MASNAKDINHCCLRQSSDTSAKRILTRTESCKNLKPGVRKQAIFQGKARQNSNNSTLHECGRIVRESRLMVNNVARHGDENM